MLERWLYLWLVLLSLLGYFWPQLLPEAIDPFLASKSYLSYLIAIIMFVVGALLPRDELWQVIKHWPTVLYGTALQYVSMPLLAFAFGNLFITDSDAYIGIILVGCVPGAMASNVLTLTAKGNVSYSVSLTTAATLLSPLVVPLTLYLCLRAHVELDPQDVFVFLLLTVVGPVLLGHGLARVWGWLSREAQRWGPALANLCILWVIAVVVGANRQALSQAGPVEVGTLLSINICGYLAGYYGGTLVRLPEGKRRALTLEVGMQNAGLGTALATSMFPEQTAAALLPALYTFGCMLTGTLLATWWGNLKSPGVAGSVEVSAESAESSR